MQKIYASPLERCQRTAAIAAALADVPIVEEAGIAEWRPEEDAAAVRARFWPVWERALRSESAALVTHGGPIALLLADLGLDDLVLGHYQKLFDHNNPLPPAGVWRASRPGPDAAWELAMVFLPETYRRLVVV